MESKPGANLAGACRASFIPVFALRLLSVTGHRLFIGWLLNEHNVAD